ncbi:CHAT domain-containing protein [Ephemerocybe angulata]|uniref:CHAT domain-containing protein n=1 Tax=Ephemerocybe angulata TaxID=980116 RepID=A0A8H6HHD2_9AGAR|nr:CHAT domain-containing protein [Tulosesus angulatus]
MRPASILALIPLALSMGSLANANDYTFDSREYVDELSAREDHFGDALAAREILSDISTRELVNVLSERLEKRIQEVYCKLCGKTPEDHPYPLPAEQPYLPSRLNNLGNAFLSRFERTGDLSDLAEAISAQSLAVEQTPGGDDELPPRLNNLGVSLKIRFERTKVIDDINVAISAQRKAMEFTPEGHPDLPSRLNNLAVSLKSRFELNNSLSLTDLDEAISSQRKVLVCSPVNHPIFPGFLNNLANSILHRFKHSGDVSNLNEAISIYENAVQLTPMGHPELSSRLINLGSAIKLFSMPPKKSPTSIAVPVHISQPDEILPAFDAAISLLALIAGLENSVKSRYAQLQYVSGLPSEAAAALALGRTDTAFEWLEQGGCLVWGQLNLLRAGAPIDDLRAHDNQLAQDVVDVLGRLERAGATRGTANTNMSLSEKIALQDEERAHLELSRKWDGLLATIHAIPGFETFSQPLSSYAALAKDLPEGGYVVIINVSEHRCDGLVISRDTSEPVHVALPRFSLATANEYRSNLGTQLRVHNLRRRASKSSEEEILTRAIRRVPVGETSHRPNPVQDILRNLWEEVVKPILEAIAIPKIDNQEAAATLPRIWWCPTGPLAFLPLHAAGVYGSEISETIHNYAISSYTPNVSSLIARVRDSRSKDSEATSGLFLTSQPSPPGASPIPGTIREVRLISDMADKTKIQVLKVEGDDVTVDECLEYMAQYSSIHLACHASQDTIDPLQSRSLFHKGSLSLGSIIQRNVKNADVAFLSACETGTGEEKVSDEVDR